jgi:putative ABC transport system permease protein
MNAPQAKPPRILEKLLLKTSRALDRDSLVDDLAGEYADILVRRGKAAGFVWYAWQVLRALPFVLGYSLFRSLVMAKNYALIAFRNMRRQKTFTFLNVAGLAIGLCLSLVVVRLVLSMYSSDRFHHHRDRIFRIITTESSERRTFELATAPMPLAGELDSLPEVEAVVRIKSGFGGPTVVGEEKLMTQGYFADFDFFRMFSYALEEGDPAAALRDPYSVVLTKALSLKLFGTKDPSGEILRFVDFGDFKVTGILEDTSHLRSHMRFECLASASTLVSLERQGKVRPSWLNWKGLNDNYCYVLLRPGISPQVLEPILSALGESHYPVDNLSASFRWQALTAISPGKNLVNALAPTTSSEEPFVLSLVAFVIILIACVNYTNLSLAKALSRAREVGIRKVIGASRFKIFSQFIGEAVTYALISLVLGLLLIQFVTPWLYRELRVYLVVSGLEFGHVLAFLAVAVFTGILAGLLPAILLSKFDPVKVLKDITRIRIFSRLTLRRVLMVVQFLFSFFFIITTVTLYRQTRFERDFNGGFNPENILNVELQKVDYETFRQEMVSLSAIADISASAFLPNTGTRWPSRVKHPETLEFMDIDLLPVDEHFLPNMEIELAAGRNFPENARLENERYVILTELAVERLGLNSTGEALGLRIEFEEGDNLEVIGVAKNFVAHLTSTPMRPAALRIIPKYFRYANLKLATEDRAAVLTALEETWKTLDPYRPPAFQFYDDQLNNAFTEAKEVLQMVSVVTLLCIMISFFGLLGMVIYDTEARIKEIGIRKVMGASLWDIVYLISRRFVLLLVLAAVLASPLAWYVNSVLFLQNMAQRIALSFGIFAMGLGAMFLVGIIIIFSQTVRAAFRNPVDSLRYE